MSAVISIHGRQDAANGGTSALVAGPTGRPVAFGDAGAVALDVFLAEVRGVAALLPARLCALREDGFQGDACS